MYALKAYMKQFDLIWFSSCSIIILSPLLLDWEYFSFFVLWFSGTLTILVTFLFGDSTGSVLQPQSINAFLIFF